MKKVMLATFAGAMLVGAPAIADTRVVDGDTIEQNGKMVRVLGIDTPERGECGFDEATRYVERFVSKGKVRLKKSPTTDNADHYGRIIRYVVVNGKDLGTHLIKKGLAKARYDSRDGYEYHKKENKYHKLDKKHKDKCSGNNKKPKASKPYENCDAAREAGAAPVYRGDPGYGRHLDSDGNGVGCE